MFEKRSALKVFLINEFPAFWEFLGIPGNSQKFQTMKISFDLIRFEFLGISGNGKAGFFLGLEFLGIPYANNSHNLRSLEFLGIYGNGNAHISFLKVFSGLR